MSISLAAIARDFGLELKGPDAEISGVNTLERAGPTEISYCDNPKYVPLLQSTKAAAVLLDAKHADSVPRALVSSRVKLDWARIVSLFEFRQECLKGVSPLACVAPDAVVSPSAAVSAFAYVGPRTRIGESVRIFPGCFVGEDCDIADGCTLYPNVTLYSRVRLGRGVVIHAGSVIGADGFGYVPGPDGLLKIPQVGRVEIGDGVEIGANTCIDRASLDATRVGAGTKIDNLVQVAHNVQIGPCCILVSQAGIAGSTKVGAGVVMGGQVGVADNLNIGDGAMLASQAGIGRDVAAKAVVGGSPATDYSTNMRAALSLQRLPELLQRVKRLEKELEALKSSCASGG